VSSAAQERSLILGRYRPLRPLGSGGMGQVWLACDEETGLDVALKIVAREGKAAARAEREARAASALRHPRCQRIYALARDSSHVYIAYEYVPGKTMRQALTAGEIDDRAAVAIAVQVLEALAHAHGRGIVHRDVKPSNVLLAEGPEVDVRLLDFGLAQMAELDTLTATGDVPGTLGFISPERLLGQPATEAADVWAVGVMLWEALAGSHPFRDAGVRETSRRIQTGAPSLADVRPDLPPRLLDAVASALAPGPGRRPSAAALAGELRALSGKGKRADREQPAITRPSGELVRSLAWRALPAATCALTAGWAASALSFYPARWPLGVAAVAGALGFAVPRAGIALALAAAFFPLANVSVGLAAVYAVLAVAWLALAWNDARAGLLAATGPLLAVTGAIGLLPLAAQLARGRVRRAVQAGTAVLLAAVVAGFRHARLPLDGSAPPLGLGIAGSARPGAVAYALWHALLDHPVLLAEAGVFAAAAVALPYARGRGPWRAAVYGAAVMAATILLAPAAPAAALVAGAWLTAALLALEPAN
jgi:eukaryotic-like serine/threonine-protein kinase